MPWQLLPGKATLLEIVLSVSALLMAACLEKSGRTEEANRHWRAYLKLDPNSQWAEVARQRLAMGQ